MVGKNFSANNLGQRRKSDIYETPYSITEQLIQAEHFNRNLSTLEPACGNGAITKVLRNKGFTHVHEYDIEQNFLEENARYSQIITNPPFSLAFEFILKAKKLTDNKFAFLLPLSYLHGKKRLDHIYKDRSFPLARIHVFCRYPMLGDKLRNDGKYRTGMMVYAWFVWEKLHNGEPSICWIDNQKHVLSKYDLKDNK
jgi:hypothetical protein